MKTQSIKHSPSCHQVSDRMSVALLIGVSWSLIKWKGITWYGLGFPFGTVGTCWRQDGIQAGHWTLDTPTNPGPLQWLVSGSQPRGGLPVRCVQGCAGQAPGGGRARGVPLEILGGSARHTVGSSVHSHVRLSLGPWHSLTALETSERLGPARASVCWTQAPKFCCPVSPTNGFAVVLSSAMYS